MPPRKGADIQAAIETIKSEYPTVTDFEREFPSLCFALATGGKPWKYLLIPHDEIAENMTLAGLASRFGVSA